MNQPDLKMDVEMFVVNFWAVGLMVEVLVLLVKVHWVAVLVVV